MRASSPPGSRSIWIGGTLLSLLLFLANYLVFQNLIQGPAFFHPEAGRYTVSTIALLIPQHQTALSHESLSGIKKREHIRTLVFQNFRGISLKERTELFDVIYNQSQAMEIDPYLTLSIIATESSFRRKAISWAGAYGLMQIKPITAEEVADDLGIPWEGEKTLFDPVVNITLGLKYLSNLKKRFGNMNDALTAYNYGPQYVVSCLRKDKKLPNNYVAKIEEHLKRYGLNHHSLLQHNEPV
ncbi:MAG: lytic transglycosylase domain-containing protein [Deltaproteobacteria bacterium]|nr:lytic transglycosylase domain-containing protein [Deltaproteobacteria bacterium]